MKLNEISGQIVDAAIKVHTTLGAGLLERPYLVCLQRELTKRGLKALTEIGMPVIYEGEQIEIGYRVDLLVEHAVIVELKSVHRIAPIHQAQLYTYLRLSGMPLGLLLNFGERHMKDGIVRIINTPLRDSASLCYNSVFNKLG